MFLLMAFVLLRRRASVHRRILAHARMGIFIRVDGIPAEHRILPMLAIRITGNQLRAGRALANLSMEDLAARARISRRTLSKWKGSSNAGRGCPLVLCARRA